MAWSFYNAAGFLKSNSGRELVSALPSSAVDGQEVFYQASGTMATDGIVWHLRYDASSASVYKWEFVGGSDLTNSNSSYPATASPSAFADIASGATVTVPLQGDYLVTYAGKHDATTSSANNYVTVCPATSAIAATNSDASATSGWGGISYSTNVMREGFSRTIRMNGVASSAVIKLQLLASGASTVVHHTSMAVRPIRVG